MPRYMIELPFAAETCTGSIPKVTQRELDFLPQVYWGCSVGKQEGWVIVQADSTDQAKSMVPESLPRQGMDHRSQDPDPGIDPSRDGRHDRESRLTMRSRTAGRLQ